MGYYLADFIKIGATFVPMSQPKMLSRDCVLFFGCLCYHNEQVKVVVKTKKGGVSKIIRTIGIKTDESDGSDEALQHRKTLRQIHRNAIDLNINGLRDCVRVRTFYLTIWLICMILMIGCLCVTIHGFVFQRGIAHLFLLLLNCFILISMYKRRWQIIPYGCIRGVSYGTKLQKK